MVFFARVDSLSRELRILGQANSKNIISWPLCILKPLYTGPLHISRPLLAVFLSAPEDIMQIGVIKKTEGEPPLRPPEKWYGPLPYFGLFKAPHGKAFHGGDGKAMVL